MRGAGRDNRVRFLVPVSAGIGAGFAGAWPRIFSFTGFQLVTI